MAFDELAPAAAHEKLTSHEGAVYVDVRSEKEFAQGHPAGAWNLPLMHAGLLGLKPNPEFLAVATKVLPRDVPLIIGCAVGGRSRRVCEILAEAGFADLTNVLGGWHGEKERLTGRVIVAGWEASGLPTATEPAEGATWSELRARSGRGSET